MPHAASIMVAPVSARQRRRYSGFSFFTNDDTRVPRRLEKSRPATAGCSMIATALSTSSPADVTR